MLIKNHHRFRNTIKNVPGLTWWIDSIDGYTLGTNGYIASVKDKSKNNNNGNLGGGNAAPEITPWGILCNRGLASCISGNSSGNTAMPSAYSALVSARYIDKGNGSDQAGIFTHTSGGGVRSLLFFFLGADAVPRYSGINTTTTAFNYMQTSGFPNINRSKYFSACVFADYASTIDFQVTDRAKGAFTSTGKTTPNTAPNNSSPFLLGKQNSASANIFQGYIHEAIFFNQVIAVDYLNKLSKYMQRKWVGKIAPVTPVGVSNLDGWWDFSDRRAVSLVSSAITGVADKSKNDIDLSQGTGNFQFTLQTANKNNLDNALVENSPSTDFMNSANASSSTTYDDFSVFFVAKITFDASTNTTFIIYGDDNGNKRWILSYLASNDTFRLRTSSDGSSYTISVFTGAPSFLNVMSGEWAIYEVIKSGTTATLWINGLSYGTTDVAPLASIFDSVYQYTIAANVSSGSTVANSGFNGTIAEVIVYSAGITTGEQEAIRGYLSRKWDI